MDEENTGAPDLGALEKAAETAAKACAELATAAKGGKADEVMAACKAADEAWDACEAACGSLMPADTDDSAEAPADETAAASAPAAAGEAPAAAPPGAVKKKTVTTEYAAASIADGLAREVAELRARENARDVRDIIQSNRAKFTPALERWALTQSPDQLRAFVAAAPARTAAAKEPQKEPPKKADIELTEAEIAVCRSQRINPEILLAHKRRELAAQEGN